MYSVFPVSFLAISLYAGNISGSLLHMPCVSTVFWDPQREHLICEALDSREKSHVYQVNMIVLIDHMIPDSLLNGSGVFRSLGLVLRDGGL
jgi:hypothetical protein